MTYSAQTFTALQVLTAAQMNQVETNIKDHVHGDGTIGGTVQTLTPSADATKNLGSASLQFANVYLTAPWIKLQKIQHLYLAIRNNGGTLEHAFLSYNQGGSTHGNFADRINNITNGYTTTPTGADASTAMAAGGKISSAGTNVFILDTNAITEDDFIIGTVASGYLDFIASLSVDPRPNSSDVNGVTRRRLILAFYNELTGGAFALNTTNIVSGKNLFCHIMCVLP